MTRSSYIFDTLIIKAGFALWAVDARHSQLELSACAGADGRWKLDPGPNLDPDH